MNDAGDAGQNRVGFEAETGQQGLESDPLAGMAERGAVEVETQCLGRTVGGFFQPQEACVRIDEAPDQPGRSQPVYPRAPARGPQPALEVSGVELCDGRGARCRFIGREPAPDGGVEGMDSFSRPGGNFTGATYMSYEVNAKRVELLREAFPHVTRVAILSNPLHPGEQRELKKSEQGAERLGIRVTYVQMRSVAEMEPALERIRAAGAEAMIVLPDGLVMQHRKRIIEFAALQRIPVISGWSEFAKSGGTMTYGPNLKASFQRLAVYVDKILKGANPAELAVEQPTKFELVINLKAAKAIGLEVPAILLGRADEVIE